MKNLKFLSIILILAYVLSACSGVPGSGGANQNDSDQQVTFTGTVESIGAGQWTISGQAVSVTGTTSVDASITVGDSVKVEAVIDGNGVIVALKIELSGDDGNSNDNNSNDNNSNDDNSNGNVNGNDNSSGDEREVIGTLEALTTGSLTINGVAYQIASFTEFKDNVAVGDLVKAHVIVNADGTFTLREIEKFNGSVNENSNTNANSNDNSNDNSNSNTNINANTNTNSNSNGNSNSNSNRNNNGNDNDDDDGNDND
jgi:hypothetical protein